MKHGTYKKEVLVETKFGKFLCIFDSNRPERGFTVTCPVAPGFITGGRNFQEAKRMAREGLEFHCECIFLEQMGQKRLDRVRLPR